ncbi:hypothetical protein ZWY2020_032794 [Hordeum vulgare]|nr:hypothetical protein ZWY2020_032794 [Hordeum vulgare]
MKRSPEQRMARKPSKRPKAEVELEAAEPSRRKRGEGEGEGPPAWRKRKRDEVKAGYERRTLVAAPAEEVRPQLVVGAKRKEPHDVEAVASGGEEDEVFDDEGKLLRTVFVENLPLRTKKKALTQEFTTFGVVDSVRIRSVPLGDVKSAKRMPRGPPPADAPARRSGRVDSLPEQPKHRFEVATLFLG